MLTGQKVGAVRIHKCDGCGKTEAWGPGWRWVIVNGLLDKSVCSGECELAVTPKAVAS